MARGNGALPLVMVAVMACSACELLHNAVNVPSLRRFAVTLAATSGARLAIAGCAMQGTSRLGYCVLEGPAGELAALASKFRRVSRPSAAAQSDDTAGESAARDDAASLALRARSSCLRLVAFGELDGGPHQRRPKADIDLYFAAGPLPPNTDNVRFLALWVGATSACFDLDFPYG